MIYTFNEDVEYYNEVFLCSSCNIYDCFTHDYVPRCECKRVLSASLFMALRTLLLSSFKL